MRTCRPCAVTSIVFFFSLFVLIFNTQRLSENPHPQNGDKTQEQVTSNSSNILKSLYSSDSVNGSYGGHGPSEGYGGGGTETRSVVFSECSGRLGNQISTFAILLVFHKIYGFTPHLDKLQTKLLSKYFHNVNFTIFNNKKIPKHLKNIQLEYQFDKLRNSSFNTGYAINIGKYPHSLTLYNHHLPEINRELKLHKKYKDSAAAILSAIAAKHSAHAQTNVKHSTNAETNVKLSTNAQTNLTFIGVHVRRDDYQKWMTKRLGRKTSYVNVTYFREGMAEYQRRFGAEVVFVAVSDDSAWISKNLGHLPDVYIGEKVLGKKFKGDPSGRDFALLCECNHTLLSYGSFGQWAALRNQGQVILPRQAKSLSREMKDRQKWATANLTKWTFI